MNLLKSIAIKQCLTPECNRENIKFIVCCLCITQEIRLSKNGLNSIQILYRKLIVFKLLLFYIKTDTGVVVLNCC